MQKTDCSTLCCAIPFISPIVYVHTMHQKVSELFQGRIDSASLDQLRAHTFAAVIGNLLTVAVTLISLGILVNPPLAIAILGISGVFALTYKVIWNLTDQMKDRTTYI